MSRAAVLVPELFRNLFHRPATRAYPFVKVEVPVGFRGTPRFTPDLCTGCKVCMRDCPSDAIHIEVESIPSTEPAVEGKPAPRPTRKMSMTLYLDRCVHCGRCAEVCPRNALALDTDFEVANFSHDALKLFTK
jgi:NADH-quinone oxidoreductase subunit I